MEMDSTSRGRSFDRSSRNAATLKKPRLVTEEPTIIRSNINNPNGNSRPIVQRQSMGFRPAVERNVDSESMAGEGYQPQSLSQIKQQQHQELVSQYRTALAELTFNSKPIITNLTIIAGENSQAAKAIAATICNNIVEVPSDQKLPSLYLLDSIVKNIGRDYIKHFSARLPEVFVKAYRQVDSTIHPGMRHLFGTWKGVFPPQSLQFIEKELGFQSVGNGSSSALTTSRTESQPQRPGRSIHVNPKYLEARQKLQQSSRAKGATSDIDMNLINSPEDTDRPDRTTANINPERARADPRLKLHNFQQAQRDAESDLTHENSGAAYNNFDFGSDISSPSETSFGKSGDRVAEQGLDKSWYGSGSNSTETISRLARNGFDIKHGLPNHLVPRPATVDVKLQPTNNLMSKRGGEVSRSWKNSEEEEYMWDDVSSRSVIPSLSNSSRRDPRLYFEPERPGFENHVQKPQRIHALGSRLERESSPDLPSTEQKDQPAFRQRMPSLRPQGMSLTDEDGHLGGGRKLSDNAGGFSTSFSGVSTNVNSLSRISLQSPTASSHIGPQGLGIPPNLTVEQQRHTLKAATPSSQAPARQRPHSQYQSSRLLHDLVEQDPTGSNLLPDADGKGAQSRGQTNTGFSSQSHQDSFQMRPQNPPPGTSRKSQPHKLQPASHQLPVSHPMKQAPFLPPYQPEPVCDTQSQKPLPPQKSVAANSSVSSSRSHQKSLVADIPGPSSSSSLLGAVSGIFGNRPIASSIPESSYQSESNPQPPLPNGPPPAQFASSGSGLLSSLKNPSSHESTSLSASILRSKTDRLPSSLGPPTSLLDSISSTLSSSVADAASNPVSSLLSTLVAKGLISALKDDHQSPSTTPTKSQSQIDDTPASQEVTPVVVSSVFSPSISSDLVTSKPAVKSTVTMPQPINEDIKSLIGFNFKPDVIREFHPAVISDLIDDLPHQCGICGLRFKLQERFDRHMEWHTLRNSESNALNTASRRWFSNCDDWINGKPDPGSSNESTTLMGGTEEALEVNGEQMVTADESQFVCILCGEMFDDFYSTERNKWMFKGAAYLNITDDKVGNMSDGTTRGLIVHENCISEHSLSDLGIANDVKVETGA
ncbi:hypothetical protein L6452_24566 [Arctium lappa]|uniref:Uncharacterized protein n=1 Tax=Arctium lappa TaxID=4217 RepID=A0ACB9A9K3_ARCLA|nr:hypothetical protein L6452_24566 [Arctium lappa]